MPKGEHLVNGSLAEFKKDSKVQQWIKGLHPNSVSGYQSGLYAICSGLNLTGSEFLKVAEANPRDLSIKVKSLIKSLNAQFSQVTLGYRIAAMNNFLDYFEVEKLPLAGLKIKRARPQPHPLLTWAEADRIISLASPTYQPVYRLMQWGMDAERFLRVNNDPKILQDVKKQLEDQSRDFIRINVAGRKSNASNFYLLIPRNVAAYLPVRQSDGELISAKWNIQYSWRRALRRAGLPIDAQHGAHNLRSCWLTEATRRGLDSVLREFQLGHQVDSLNYQRIMQDQQWVLEQFRKAWQIKPVATREELTSLQEENKTLKEIVVADLREQLENVRIALGEAEGPELERLQFDEKRLVERLGRLGVEPAAVKLFELPSEAVQDGYPVKERKLKKVPSVKMTRRK